MIAKIKLNKIDRGLEYKVLEMEGIERGEGVLFSNLDMSLASFVSPDLSRAMVVLCGINYTNDDITHYKFFRTNEDRDIYYNRVHKLFEDFRHYEEMKKNV